MYVEQRVRASKRDAPDTEFPNGRISTVFNNVRGTGRPWEWIGFAAMVQRNDVRIRPQSPNNLMIARSLPDGMPDRAGWQDGVTRQESIAIRCSVILALGTRKSL